MIDNLEIKHELTNILSREFSIVVWHKDWTDIKYLSSEIQIKIYNELFPQLCRELNIELDNELYDELDRKITRKL